MKPKKSWTEKLNDARPHEVKPVPINIAGMKTGQIMLVPSPRIVDDFIRMIPQGVSMDVKTLRQKLASTYHAEVTCPITMGFHLRTVAEAAFEAFNHGADLSEITPIWRVLGERTPTLSKLSFDPAFILEQRASEGL
jgi:hypothetical protein